MNTPVKIKGYLIKNLNNLDQQVTNELLTEMESSEEKLYQNAYLVSLFSIIYNLLENAMSMLFGFKDQTLALFGFGVDSFIEVI